MIKLMSICDYNLLQYGLNLAFKTHVDIDVVIQKMDLSISLPLFQEHSHSYDVILILAYSVNYNLIKLVDLLDKYSLTQKVLMVINPSSYYLTQDFLRHSVSGCIANSCDFESLVVAVRKIAAGERYVSDTIARQFALDSFEKIAEIDPPLHTLSERELQVMQMIARGLQVNQISELLQLSAKTVNTYRYRLFEKLKITNDVQMTRIALRHNVVSIEQLPHEDFVEA